MSVSSLFTFIKQLQVKAGSKVNLKKYDTDYDHKMVSKDEGSEILERGIKQLAEMQDKLYAHNEYSMLIVFQAMDAAGKDSSIKHIMSGLNPQGVKVTSFKTPSSTELDHDYFWRHYKELPARGEIGIFNRSHYENVLVTRVHPEYILNENLPSINSLKDVDQDFWQQRYRQINRFEKNINENGTIILKFFLHISKKEQKKRFLERIDDPSKNWKFALGDLKERDCWDKYMKAYEEMLSATSQPEAPWFVIPADDKWFARLAIASIIYREFEKMKFSYPVVTKEAKADLQKAKKLLLAEKD
jgi:PPK2 family polyphosphate:nucleotide phosphotransferase